MQYCEFVNMNVYIFLISKHLIEMKRRSRLTDSDRLLKQVAKYVIVTFVLFHTCFIGYVGILIFRVSEFLFQPQYFSIFEYFTFITILLNSCYGILNILTFAGYTSGYRKAVCDLSVSNTVGLARQIKPNFLNVKIDE